MICIPIAFAMLAPDMEASLKATGLNYAKSPSGLSYTMLFDHPNSKQRTVYVGAKEGKVAGISSFVIYTSVWVSKEAPTQAILDKFMYKAKKFGHFYLFKDTKGSYVFRFGAHYNAQWTPADPTATDPSIIDLMNLIYFVNQVGQESMLEVEKGG